MNEARYRKELVSGLVDLLSQAIQHDRLEDAELVLACVRALRPRLAELDTFEAWIAMKRGFWPDAIRILRNVDAAAGNWALGKALMAFCQFALGDAAWRASATDVVENGQSVEALDLVMLLIDPEAAVSERAQANTAQVPAVPPKSAHEFASKTYLRA
jgi:type III secretion protein HrpB1